MLSASLEKKLENLRKNGKKSFIQKSKECW
jgi:hypothetical protein